MAQENWYHRTSAGAWLRVWGTDAFRFLQGQFSQDLNRVAIGGVAYGLWLDRKGRIEGDGFLLREGEEEFRIYSVGTSGEKLAERFARFLIADDVEVENLRDTVEVIGLGGECVALLGESPPQEGFLQADQGWCFHGKRETGNSLEWIGPPEAANALEERLATQSGLEPLTVEAMERMRIEAGIPAIPRDLDDRTLPQEAGLESAVSFTKGCFLGQEIVAKVRNSGGYRRSLIRVRGEGDLPKDEVVRQEDREIGVLRSRVKSSAGWVGFALLKHRELNPEIPLAIFPSGASVRLEPA